MKTIKETRGRKSGSFRVEYKLTATPKKFDIKKRGSIYMFAKRRGLKIKTGIIDGELWVSLAVF